MPDSFLPSKVAALACLTLLVPVDVEQRVVDWLIAQPHADIEFSVHEVAARGPLVQLGAGDEQVLGCARRVELTLIAPRAQVTLLIRSLSTLLAGVAGGYWVTPVECFAGFPAMPLADDAADDVTHEGLHPSAGPAATAGAAR